MADSAKLRNCYILVFSLSGVTFVCINKAMWESSL